MDAESIGRKSASADQPRTPRTRVFLTQEVSAEFKTPAAADEITPEKPTRARMRMCPATARWQASSDAPPRGATDDGEKILLLAGVADKPRRKRSYYRRLVDGDAPSVRLFGAMAFLAIGAVAAVLNVTVERVEHAPTSHRWMQNLASSGDPNASVHVAGGARKSAADDSVVAVTRAARLRWARRGRARGCGRRRCGG